MAAKLEKTQTPGIYKRGSRYAVIYRDTNGRQRQESVRTYDEARRLRARRAASVDDGSHTPQTRERFADYAMAWIGRYQGNGRRGFTQDTRAEYRRDLARYAIPYLGRLRLEQSTLQSSSHGSATLTSTHASWPMARCGGSWRPSGRACARRWPRD